MKIKIAEVKAIALAKFTAQFSVQQFVALAVAA